MPTVSIVLPVFNSEQYLRECFESCLAQTFADFELICVDGGSRDATLAIIQEYMERDARIQLVHQPANSGKLPGALNLGFARTQGQYLAWMQSDSLYTPDAIRTMKTHLEEHPAVDFVYANYHVIGLDSAKILESVEVDPIEMLKRDNPIGMCHMWKRRVYERIGDHDVTTFLAEDYDYWCRIYRAGFKMEKIDQYLYYWRRHPGSLTYNNYGIFESSRQAARVRLRWVNPDRFFFARSMAKIYIDEAFIRQANREVAGTRNAVLRGLLYNPAWFFNRGVLSLLVQSLTGRLKEPVKGLNWPPY